MSIAIEQELDQLFEMMREYHDMRDLLQHIQTFLDGRMDADDGIPNPEMRMAISIENLMELIND